jgi:hypothetical protein
METINPILENPLLIAAILLFLAILPRALRQREKTALDKAVERFEKEELKTAAEGKSDEDIKRQKKPIALEDGSLAYLKGNLSASQKMEEQGGIPPFPAQEEDKKVKIVKPGVPISHYETADPPLKKKVKLIRQEFSIAPDKNKVSSKKVSSDPIKDKASKPPTNDQKSTWSGDSAVPPISDNEESKGNWIEAEIPGLTIEPPAEEKSETIPVFDAFPKEKYQTEAEKSQKSPPKEKQAPEVKNIAPKTEEKKDPKPEKQVIIRTDSPELEMENSESKPKEVEIKASVVSHKNIAIKEAETQKAEAPPSRTGETEKTKAEVTVVPHQRDDIKTSPEMAKLKPFLLDLRYLDQEELETGNPISCEELPADRVDVTIARLNALQADLENQLVSIPGKAISREALVDDNMRKDRTQDSLPDLGEAINKSSGTKEVSLEKLDSFLFTATQRKNRE